MYINSTVSQGLQILISARPVAPDEIDVAASPAKPPSSSTTGPLKQAAATIGEAMLNLGEKSVALDPLARCSPGVRYYERIEDMEDPAERAYYYQVEAQIELSRRVMKETAGIHNWDSATQDVSRDMIGVMGMSMSGKWTYDAEGSLIPEAYMEGMHPVNARIARNFPQRIETLLSSLSEVADVHGDVIVKDGTSYGWGTFEVRDKSTGALYFNHSGDGKVQFHDKGGIFAETDAIQGFDVPFVEFKSISMR